MILEAISALPHFDHVYKLASDWTIFNINPADTLCQFVVKNPKGMFF